MYAWFNMDLQRHCSLRPIQPGYTEIGLLNANPNIVICTPKMLQCLSIQKMYASASAHITVEYGTVIKVQN